MKKHLAILVSAICLLLACTLLIGCNDTPAGNDDQKGETIITLMRKNAPSGVAFIYAEGDDVARDAATSYRSTLASMNLRGAIMGVSSMIPSHRAAVSMV